MLLANHRAYYILWMAQRKFTTTHTMHGNRWSQKLQLSNLAHTRHTCLAATMCSYWRAGSNMRCIAPARLHHHWQLHCRFFATWKLLLFFCSSSTGPDFLNSSNFHSTNTVCVCVCVWAYVCLHITSERLLLFFPVAAQSAVWLYVVQYILHQLFLPIWWLY